MRKVLLAIMTIVTAATLSGCAVRADVGPGCFWVPPHHDRFGFYHRGHYRC